jgi:methionyl aminopeptidase
MNETLSKENQKIIIKNGLALAKVLNLLADKIAIGVSELEIEDLARKEIKKSGGEPAFLNYPSDPGPYPAAACISVNDEVVHSPPTDRKFKSGDLISVDLGYKKDGIYTDACFSVLLKSSADNSEDARLLLATKEALELAIEQAKPGNRTGDIGYVVERTARKHGFTPIKCLTGHGIGTNLHQDPSIFNYGEKNTGALLEPGMAIAIEPILTDGQDMVKSSPNSIEDPFTIRLEKGGKAAHFEDTILITETGPKVLTKQIFYGNLIKDSNE